MIQCDRCMDENDLIRRGRHWTKALYCIQGGRLLKIKRNNIVSPEEFNDKSRKSDDIVSLEDDELEVEQFMDLGLCKFEAIQINSKNN
jgi:hypothetical protein